MTLSIPSQYFLYSFKIPKISPSPLFHVKYSIPKLNFSSFPPDFYLLSVRTSVSLHKHFSYLPILVSFPHIFLFLTLCKQIKTNEVTLSISLCILLFIIFRNFRSEVYIIFSGFIKVTFKNCVEKYVLQEKNK